MYIEPSTSLDLKVFVFCISWGSESVRNKYYNNNNPSTLRFSVAALFYVIIQVMIIWIKALYELFSFYGARNDELDETTRKLNFEIMLQRWYFCNVIEEDYEVDVRRKI